MKLCGVCIITNDVPKLVDFYKVVFEVEPEGDSVHSAFDSMQLAIWNPGNTEISSIKNMSLMFFVDNADYEYEKLNCIENIRDLAKPKIEPWGVKAFTFKDPDGNEINFIEKLK